MPTDSELLAVMADHLDYDEDAARDWEPYIFCLDCRATFDVTWGDFDEESQLAPGLPWRLAADHWIAEHGSAAATP